SSMKKCGEKSEEEPQAKKQQNIGEKVWKIAGKRGGIITPVLPFPVQLSSNTSGKLCLTVSLPAGASARQVGATVWELHQYNLPFARMHNSGGSRRNHRYLQLNHHNHHHHHRQHLLEDSHDPAPATPELVTFS
ncbi:hypothetical protein Tco_0258803, partial [Tanacetum coccineum]